MPQDNLSEELKRLWQARVDDAYREYDVLRLKAAEALENLDCNARSEEIEALTEAQRREAAALREYMRLLRVFHELLVTGRKPED